MDKADSIRRRGWTRVEPIVSDSEDPPQFLRPDDVVEVWKETIGTLIHTVTFT